MAQFRIQDNDQYYAEVLAYFEHLQNGGADLLLNPPVNASASELLNQMFTDSELITSFMLGSLGAWSVGLTVGLMLKYMARLK